VELAQAARKQAYDEQEKEGRKEARTFVPRQLWIAGSIGPYGAHLANGSEYTGAYDPMPDYAGFKEYHRQRIRVLKDAGVDLFALETMPCFTEVEAVLEVLEEEAKEIPCWISASLGVEAEAESGRVLEGKARMDEMARWGDGTMADGTPLTKLAELVQEKDNVVAVGVNCIKSEAVHPALRALHRRMSELDDASHTRPSKGLICYPNSGETWDGEARGWKRKRGVEEQGPRQKTLEDYLESWSQIAVDRLFIVGGCCRVGPEETKRMRTRLDRFVEI